MKKNVTAKDIARYCGVSQATVSYVINNRSNQKISQETRQKILDAIEELHYYPNASARMMKTKSSSSVAIVCARDYSRQAFLNAMTGISRAMTRANYTISVYYEEDFPASESARPQYITNFHSNLVDGLIYISNHDHKAFMDRADAHQIPYVVLCMDGVFSRNTPMPHAFDEALMECARFCGERNFRDIRYFSVDNDGVFVNNKYPVFENALATVAPQCHLTHVTLPAKDRNLAQMRHFLEDYMKDQEFDLAISQNYDIGLLVQREILKRGFTIPQGTRNLFLNDVNFYNMSYPSISGIYVPYEEMGEYAASLIMAIIEDSLEEFNYQDFTCHMIHRESTW